MDERRNRGGRPRGSGKDDSRDLNRVADLMAKDRNLKKTPAISRVVMDRHPPHHWQKMERRLLRKWNLTGEDRLNEARQRLDERRRIERADREEATLQRSASDMRRSVSYDANSLAAAARAAMGFDITSLTTAAQAAAMGFDTRSLTAAAQAAKMAHLSIEQLGFGSTAAEMERQLRAVVDPLRGIDAASSVREAMAALDSPTMRAMRQIEEQRDRIQDMINPGWRLL